MSITDLSLISSSSFSNEQVVLVNLLNFCYGVIFTVKLRQFVKLGESAGSDVDRFRFEALIIKNDLLTFVGILSTTVFYSFWAITGFQKSEFLYLDVFLNCLVIGMF